MISLRRKITLMIPTLLVFSSCTRSLAYCSVRVFTTATSPFSSQAMMSSSPSDGESGMQSLKVLALHGSGGNGPNFVDILQPLSDWLFFENGIQVQITAPTAPFTKENGFAWWTMSPGTRSFDADIYIGFETSSEMVLKILDDEKPDLVLAHSQGAILISALLGLDHIATHPSRGYILNGVAWPNPVSKEISSLKVGNGVSPRVLFVTGKVDKINPPSSAQQVKTSLDEAGFQISTCEHPGGHSVPITNEEAKKSIANWIVR
mmetsp:Transcript_9751/g.13753  ORF Transcript_9751/g.13753 Transcript_9751/m.13753 type:complete len:262 (+) Transcript_9751:97-882(+)